MFAQCLIFYVFELLAPSPDKLVLGLAILNERSLRIGLGYLDWREVVEGVTKLEDAGRGADKVHGSELLWCHLGVINSDFPEGHGRW